MISLEKWKPADGLVLEPNALKAAKEVSSSLALTAGPGAGKSEMLAQRADFLLRTHTCRYPKRILAISFKVDACTNLKDRVYRRCGRDLGSRFDSYTFHAFAKRIIDRFRPVLVGRDALNVDYTIGPNRIAYTTITFDDLIPLAIKILTASKLVRRAIRQTYSDVFLDEFQDCTTAQYELIKLAFQGTNIRLVAVGDTKQKIMAWAGAMEGIFLSFVSDFQATPLNLYRNFRSKPTLLRMQNEIIKTMDIAASVDDASIIGDAGVIEVHEFDNSESEADFIVERIERWSQEDKIPFNEIAILVSRQIEFYADLVMAGLQQKNIPFRNEQSLQDLSTEPITRLIIDFLLVIIGGREPEAYMRLMQTLTANSTDDEDYSRNRSNWNTFIKAQRAIVLAAEQNFITLWQAAKCFLKEFGGSNLAALSADYQSAARVRELIVAVKGHLANSLEEKEDAIQALKFMTEDCGVRVLTIHKSKGLEFDRVIILGVESQTFWGELVDERCAYFVGVSRAKTELVLTHSSFRRRPDPSPRRWDQSRQPHEEFLGYALPFVQTQPEF